MNGIERIYSLNVKASTETLRAGFEKGGVARVLIDPLQALLPRITRAATDLPVSIYLFSKDQYAETRDFFGYALAHALQQQIPTALLVDCGFMNLGLHGIIPQKDALGFLDLLLYGSSLEIITQETVGGVKVVGAGSFPVTKKMPFVLNAFKEASRRLVAGSRCAVFCGPLYNDDGDLHPLIGAVDIPILVGGPAAAGKLDPIEEQIASRLESEKSATAALVSIRITSDDAAVPEPVSPVPPPAEEHVQGATPEQPEAPQTAGVDDAPQREFGDRQTPAAAPPPAPPDESSRFEPIEPPPSRSHPDTLLDVELESRPYREQRYSSLLPKIATGLIAVLVVVFVVWWLNLEKGGPAEPDQQSSREVVQTTPPPATGDQRSSADADPGETEAARGDKATGESTNPSETGQVVPDSVAREQETPAIRQTTGQPSAGTGTQAQGSGEVAERPRARLDSRNIIVMSDVQNSFPGRYLIHISSFRQSDKARNEVTYLESRGFPVFIVFMNLGPKGTWYRVYAGPLDTREEARNMKKLLDDTPQVRFTRITRVSGSS